MSGCSSIRKRLLALGALTIALAAITNADAYWTSTGTGNAYGNTGTLDAPANLTAVASIGGIVALSWSEVTPPFGDPSSVMYYVTRDGGDPGGDCPTSASPAFVLACTDAELAPGTYSYTVTAVWRTWTSTGDPREVTVAIGALDHFLLTTPTQRTAGQSFNSLRITAQDSANQTVTPYTGTHCIVFSGPEASPNGTLPSYPAPGAGCSPGESAVNFTNGVSNLNSINITLYRATPSTLYLGTTTIITATDTPSGKNGSTNPFNVVAAGQSRFLILPETTTPVAGQADNLTIVMGDNWGNPINSYGGAGGNNYTLRFSGAGNAPDGTRPTVTPRNSTTGVNFGSNTSIRFVNGVATVSAGMNGVMRLYRVEAAAVRVRQNNGAYQSNPLTFDVQAAPITTFTVANPAAQTAGDTFNLSITATDDYDNANTGTRCLTFSGPLDAPDGTPPSYPAQGSCAAGQSEVVFTGAPTLVPITLYRAASTTLTVTDVASGYSDTTTAFTVNPAPIDHFDLAAAILTPTAGQADNLTIAARDAWDNAATGYTGAHNLTFSGAASIRTYDPTVTNRFGTQVDFGDTTSINFTNGVSTVSGGSNGVMRLYKAQTAYIVVSDGSHTNGSGLEVTVSPAAMDNLALAVEKVVVRPGASDQLTIRAIDQYGNPASGYADGPHNVTFSGGSGSRTVTDRFGNQIAFGSPTSITFTNGISTAGGVMQIADVQTAIITVTDGTHTSDPLRIVVSSVSATAVAAGGFHTCALVSGGVQCWGYNNQGQLGDNTTTDRLDPVRVVGVGGSGYLGGVSQITASKYHTCALVSGSVYCWGQNDYGQIGDMTNTDRTSPTQVRTGPTSFLQNVVQVSAGGGHTCARRSDGTVWCWGYNPFGQLGNDDDTNTNYAVQAVGIATASEVAAGHNHTCAALTDGSVRCWGYNLYGEVGDGTTTNRDTPTQVRGPGGSGFLGGVASVTAGRFHSCALLSDQTVYCWGDNEHGELGDGTNIDRSFPVRSGEISTALTVSAGEYHSCASLEDGTAQCWGAAAFGQIGDGTTADTSSPVTVIGPGGYGALTVVAAISAGGGNWPDGSGSDNYEHSCALLSDGTVVTWGQNIYGQLGDGTTTMSITPVGLALL